ncbi:MAG: hypothetical protein JW913_06555 [Chitinispirillaceae bacterium]|nr:hypothetical protein [Chitinispirillaceae bacterium]
MSAVLSIAVAAAADVVLPDYHTVERCVKIADLDNFPDIAIVGAYTALGSIENVERYLVTADSCLTKGTAFNALFLFWVEKNYLESTGLANLPLADYMPYPAKRKIASGAAAPIGLIPEAIEPYGATVPDSNLTVKESLVYKLIATSSAEGVTVYLAEKVTVDKNGGETRNTYNPPVNTVLMPRKGTGIAFPADARLLNGYMLLTPGFNATVKGVVIDCRGRAVLRFTRACRAGATYLIPSAGLAAGVYRLQISTTGKTTVLPLNFFK